MHLSGRRALVTGGGRGIGRAIAAALTVAGHRVTVLGRGAAALDEAVAAGDAERSFVADVTDLDGLARAIAGEITDAGPFAILVNNAGSAATGAFLKTDGAALRAMLAVNVEGPAACIRACLPAMVERGFGRIVTVASTAGLKGYAYVSGYVAAKHAVVGLTRALALEVAKSGVTVNALCPGYTDTDLVAEGVRTIAVRTGRSEAEARAHFTATNPMGRLVRPEEVADAAVWLAGDGAGAVTGQAIAIAGGEI